MLLKLPWIPEILFKRYPIWYPSPVPILDSFSSVNLHFATLTYRNPYSDYCSYQSPRVPTIRNLITLRPQRRSGRLQVLRSYQWRLATENATPNRKLFFSHLWLGILRMLYYSRIASFHLSVDGSHIIPLSPFVFSLMIDFLKFDLSHFVPGASVPVFYKFLIYRKQLRHRLSTTNPFSAPLSVVLTSFARFPSAVSLCSPNCLTVSLHNTSCFCNCAFLLCAVCSRIPQGLTSPRLLLVPPSTYIHALPSFFLSVCPCCSTPLNDLDPVSVSFFRRVAQKVRGGKALTRIYDG